MIDQADAKEIHTGWTYSQAGTPVAFVMPVNAPGDATVIAFDNWWSALRFGTAARRGHAGRCGVPCGCWLVEADAQPRGRNIGPGKPRLCGQSVSFGGREMSWREQAKAILQAGHNRHDRHNSPDLNANVPNVPNVPGVVALDSARVLKVWHGRLSKLDPLRPPEGFRKSEWADLVDDSWWLYENFASVALRQGWGAQGLWGVRVGVPHGGGLAQLMRTSRSVLFSDGITTVTRLGVQMKRNPECGHGCPLVWEVANPRHSVGVTCNRAEDG